LLPASAEARQTLRRESVDPLKTRHIAFYHQDYTTESGSLKPGRAVSSAHTPAPENHKMRQAIGESVFVFRTVFQSSLFTANGFGTFSRSGSVMHFSAIHRGRKQIDLQV
jgi:hypothetical protein